MGERSNPDVTVLDRYSAPGQYFSALRCWLKRDGCRKSAK